jgi:hypothetical protein
MEVLQSRGADGQNKTVRCTVSGLWSNESFGLLVAQIIRGLLIQIGMQPRIAVHTNIQHISLSELADYAAGRVFARTTLSELEEHLLLCGECQRLVVKLDNDASSRRRPLEITHSTADGPIRLWVEQSLSGGWQARYTGGHTEWGTRIRN